MGSTSKKHKRDKDVSRKHKHRSRSPRSRSESPIDVSDYNRNRDRDRGERRAAYNPKKYKESRSTRNEREEYHSDSSDVVEVPIAPPAPKISHPTRSPSPIPENGAGDCLSIEQTNKLRAKLGLKPLEFSSASSSKPSGDDKHSKTKKNAMIKDDWGEFYHKPATNISEKKKSEKIRERLRESREKRAIEERLASTKTLGDSESDDDAKAWVSKNREILAQKKEAANRAKVLQEMDEEFHDGAVLEQKRNAAKRRAYRDKDLKGLKVDHNLDDFTEGTQVILTLKDQDVLGEDDDTLVNVNMIDNERYKKSNENKKQKVNMYGYDVYANEEVDEYGIPTSRPILGKYDDEIGGEQKKGFTLGSNLRDEIEQKRKLLEIKCKLQNKKMESLDTVPLTLASEYYSPSEVASFKKPKKKIRKIRQTLKADDLLAITTNNAVSKSDTSRDAVSKKKLKLLVNADNLNESDDFSNIKIEDDNEDLELVLAKARRLKQKEAIINKALSMDDVLVKNEIKSEVASDGEDNDNDYTDNTNIILNATAEFCRTLGDIPTYGLAGNRAEVENELMTYEEEPEEKEEEKEEIDCEESHGTWNSVNPDTEAKDIDTKLTEISEVAILDEEPDVASGIAGALRLAMSKGYLEKEESNRPSNSRFAHLQAKNYSIEDKTHADDDKYSRRDRYSGPLSDFKEKETFKPNVKLEYIDDNGHLLNAKEAFRYLSHKFHGKGPGKNKVEKRLKKTEQEGLMMKMSSTDTPLGTLNMLQAKQKETQSSYIILSGSKQTHATNIVKQQKR